MERSLEFLIVHHKKSLCVWLRRWGVANWEVDPPVVTLKCCGQQVSTSASAALAWNARFLFRLVPELIDNMIFLEVHVDQPRSFLRGGNIAVAKGIWRVDRNRGSQASVESVQLELNPQFCANASHISTPSFPGSIIAAGSGHGAGANLRFEASILARDDADELVARCAQGAEDSDDEDEDEDEDEDGDADDEGTGTFGDGLGAPEGGCSPSAANLAPAEGPGGVAAAVEPSPSAVAPWPEPRASAPPEKAQPTSKKSALRVSRATRGVVSRAAARRRTPEDLAAAKAEADAEALLASITVRSKQPVREETHPFCPVGSTVLIWATCWSLGEGDGLGRSHKVFTRR